MKKIITYEEIAGILVCLLLFVCSGCIHQELPECDDDNNETCIRLQFQYDYNMQYTDLFAEQVDHITLVIYTTDDGQLVQIQEIYRQDMEENHTVSLTLSPGQYTAVAWGNCHTDHYKLSNHETMSDMQLEMTCIDPVKMIMTEVNPGSLFYGSTSIPVVAGEEPIIPMMMVKNSNQVKVVIKGLTTEDWIDAKNRFELRLTSRNWRYDFANEISTEQKITYITELVKEEAPNEDPEEITVAFMFYPLKLSTWDEETELTLQYRNPVTDRGAVLKRPLVPYLLSQNNGNIELKITPTIDPEDEYLIRQDTYEVPFTLGIDSEGNIQIKDWNDINQGGGL